MFNSKFRLLLPLEVGGGHNGRRIQRASPVSALFLKLSGMYTGIDYTFFPFYMSEILHHKFKERSVQHITIAG